MRLDSVREVKAEVDGLLRSGALAAVEGAGFYRVGPGGVRAFDVHASRRAALDRNQPLVALGVQRAPGGREGYRLAVRIQRRGLEGSEAIEEITRRAAGEVDVRYIGTVVKRAGRPWHRARARPLLIGTSVGHVDVTAGTLGCFVTGPARRRRLELLSNNHVLADENQAEPGDAILQPGAYDGGTARDRVARLRRFVPLRTRAANVVDCAVGELDDAVAAEPATLRGVGRLTGRVDDDEVAEIETVGKIGRTTGFTEGRITAFELDGVTVAYDIGLLRFDGQIEIEGAGPRAFSDGGDSGSLVFTSEECPRAAALVFAGSDQGGANGKGLTYANPVGTVLQRLRVELAT